MEGSEKKMQNLPLFSSGSRALDFTLGLIVFVVSAWIFVIETGANTSVVLLSGGLGFIQVLSAIKDKELYRTIHQAEKNREEQGSLQMNILISLLATPFTIFVAWSDFVENQSIVFLPLAIYFMFNLCQLSYRYTFWNE